MRRDRCKPNRRGGADEIEAWLTEHPEANADLADLQHLKELCRATAAPEPDEAVWTDALRRLATVTPVGRLARRPMPRRSRWVFAGLATAAAAAVLIGTISWLTVRTRPLPDDKVPSLVEAEEPFAVAESDDVNIISMDARDVALLVVGDPPVSGELIFAHGEDIRVKCGTRCPVSGGIARL
jgi:anti-sigma factor RsiW